MLKIAYLSNYRDSTGYSSAARGYINGLKKTSCDLATRHIHLSGEEVFPVFENEEGTLDNIDVCIQHTLPSFFRKTKARWNVGVFTWETTKIPDEWANSINKNMDLVLVPSRQDAQACENSVKKPVVILGYPTNIDKSTINFDAKLKHPIINKDTFVFYSIVSESPRKNLNALIMSYLYEFREKDNCILFLHISSGDKDQVEKSTIEMIESIKEELGFEDYAKIAISSGILDEKTIQSLHIIFDCYVSVSHGESWNYPLFDAYCLNNKIITVKNGGPEMFLPKEFPFVKSTYSPVYGISKSSGGLYNAKSNWLNFFILDLVEKMRLALSSGKTPSSINNDAFSRYSAKNIGRQLMSILKGIST